MTSTPHTEHRPVVEIESEGGRLFGLRRSALLEIVVFIAAILLVDFLFGPGNRFYDVAPHPFWFVIMLVSAQYGSAEGTVAALAATVALLVGNFPEQGLQEDYYAYVLELTYRPGLWLITGVVLGELRDRQIRERDGMRIRLREAEELGADLADSYQRLAEAKEHLEQRVAGQLQTFFTTYNAAKTIEKLGTGQVLLGVSDLVRSVITPRKFSLYMLNGDRLEPAVNEGWTSDDPYGETFHPAHPLYHAVIGEKRYLNAANEDDAVLLKGEGVLAGPLIAEDGGEVLGMLKIEALDFFKLNSSTQSNFKILCDWIGTAYANARRYETAAKDTMRNEKLGVLSSGFFDRQADFFTRLGKRVGFDVSVVKIALDNAHDLSRDRADLAGRIIGHVAQATLRDVDQTFQTRKRGYHFSTLLLNTPLENTDIVLNRLRAGLDEGLGEAVPEAKVTLTAAKLYRASDDG